MAISPHDLNDEALSFLQEVHIASLSTLMPSGALHVVPVSFSYEPADHTVRIVSSEATVKVRNSLAGCEGALSFFDSDNPGRWISLHGKMAVRREPERVLDTLERYEERYGREPRYITDRISLEIQVSEVRGSFERL